ncbi:alpha-2,8-sialyltransferase 8E-like [Saccoglossus kowalevskii]|uniref:Alpha-2,8-sialyltransferase 8E-like n=1 Tax=Saccoglossus kowalevskii TaxID=10224 RepID=A0ABM0MBK7_SACKO|nr:PREDICTED: alpha-2,8-sialyltransferase 8E-like [Saccoglossus kowalevskii]
MPRKCMRQCDDRNGSAPRKITSRQRRVQRMLAATVTKLQYWEQNKTRAEVIRNDLNQMNGSDFIFTQENSPVGRMYYNTYHRRAAKIDGSRRKLLPKVSPFSNTTLFRTCAVIGNGGVLKNSGCGKDIDSFDFVFRSNLQPIKNYSTDAGMKTNMTSLNPSVIKLRFHHLKKQEHKTDLLKALKEYEGYLLWIPNSATITTTMAFKAAKIIQEDTRLQILLVDADHCRHFGKYWQIKRIISTGMILVNIAISLCEEIHVYGFWPFRMDVRGNPLLMHYTDDLKWSSYHYVHDYSREFTLLTKLHFDGVIKLHVNQCMES